jgi:cytochrome c biogenesis protein CcdA
VTLELLLTIGGLALLDTLSPAIVGISLFILLSGARRVAGPLFAYLATVAVFYFAVGVALMLGLDAALTRLEGITDSSQVLWAQLALGVGMLVGALVMPTKRNAPRREPSSLRLPVVIGLGLTTGVVEVGMALPYLGAIGLMTAAELPVALWMVLLGGYNLVMILPGVLLYLSFRLLGARLRPRLEQLRDRMANAGREAFGWVLGIAGFLIARHAAAELGLFQLIDRLSDSAASLTAISGTGPFWPF